MISLLVFLLSCATSTVAECSEKDPCAFGEECVEGQCVSQTCATSDQCDIEQYCSEDQKCVAGCKEDTDCKFGDLCNTDTKTCELAECTDTHLDCGFGQFCSINGDCYDAGGYFCADCEDAGDCGGNGNKCYGGYCAVTCDTDRDCPNGFSCLQYDDVTHVCYAPCYLQEGKE